MFTNIGWYSTRTWCLLSLLVVNLVKSWYCIKLRYNWSLTDAVYGFMVNIAW